MSASSSASRGAPALLFLFVSASFGLAACGQPAGNQTASASASASVARPPANAAASAPASSVATSSHPGAPMFAKYCALCHGPDAKGYAADNAPSLVNPTFLASASDAFLAQSIREGRPGTAMAGYGADRGGPLADADIATIIAFLRTKGPAYVPLPASPASGVASWGEELYERNCQACHGTRLSRATAPHLANAAFLSAASDEFLRHAITRGRPGTPMQSFAGALHPNQIDDLVTMFRSWSKNPPEKPQIPTEPPLEGPVVINPKGKTPSFTLREERYVPADQVKKAYDAKNRMVIIDARATSDWLSVRIPGSISVPYYQMTRLDGLPNDGTWILAYCACPHHASGAIVDELRKRGFTKTAVIDEGILEWQKRRYPIEGTGAEAARTAADAAAKAAASSKAPARGAPVPPAHPGH